MARIKLSRPVTERAGRTSWKGSMTYPDGSGADDSGPEAGINDTLAGGSYWGENLHWVRDCWLAGDQGNLLAVYLSVALRRDYLSLVRQCWVAIIARDPRSCELLTSHIRKPIPTCFLWWRSNCCAWPSANLGRANCSTFIPASLPF